MVLWSRIIIHVLTTNHITTKLTNPNQDQRHKSPPDDSSLDSEDDYRLGAVVETSVTNNSLSKDYPHPDDHAQQINN